MKKLSRRRFILSAGGTIAYTLLLPPSLAANPLSPQGSIQPGLLKQGSLQLSTNLNSLTNLLEWYEQLIRPLISFESWWQSQLILDEGFTNAVRHAHRFLPATTPIVVEVKLFRDWLEIQILDRGQPFDLEAKLQQLHQASDKLYSGGRGLLFMDQLTDELCYTRLPDQRNCLMMRKRLA